MLLAAAVLATACQRSAETSPRPVIQVAQAAAAQPSASAAAQLEPDMQRMMALMRVIYGASKDDHVIAALPDYGDRKETGRYRLRPVAMRELGDGRVALVANANFADDEEPSHGQPGLLNAYLLQKQGAGWQVLRRFENVAEMGSWGRLGIVKWVELGAGRPGFAVISGGTWQGTTIRNMALFDLGDAQLRDLAEKVGLVASDNDGDCEEDRQYCWNIEGRWRFERTTQQAYDDLVFEFDGFAEGRAEGGAQASPRKRVSVSGTARYAFRDGEYVLASGEHLVPSP